MSRKQQKTKKRTDTTQAAGTDVECDVCDCCRRLRAVRAVVLARATRSAQPALRDCDDTTAAACASARARARR